MGWGYTYVYFGWGRVGGSRVVGSMDGCLFRYIGMGIVPGKLGAS